jgi:hypothetical protein
MNLVNSQALPNGESIRHSRNCWENGHRKRRREWEIFQTFCQSTDLGAEPADVIMFDPSSSHPAPPDLKCQVANGPRFFELGEVVQQNLAEASAPIKKGSIAKPYMPPIRIWDPRKYTHQKAKERVRPGSPPGIPGAVL